MLIPKIMFRNSKSFVPCFVAVIFISDILFWSHFLCAWYFCVPVVATVYTRIHRMAKRPWTSPTIEAMVLWWLSFSNKNDFTARFFNDCPVGNWLSIYPFVICCYIAIRKRSFEIHNPRASARVWNSSVMQTNSSRWRIASTTHTSGLQFLVFVGQWPFVFAQPTALQLRDPYYISKKEDRRCWDRLAP